MLGFYAVVVIFFALTWLVEYRFGVIRKIDTYNLSEFFSNISMGLTSTVVSLCVTLISLPLYEYLYNLSALSLYLQNIWINILLGVVLYDFLYYWNHRWHHEISVLWLGHSVHHSGQTFNYSTSLRLGVIASLTSWVMFMPMALMGIKVEVYLAIYAVQLFYQHLIHTQHIPKLGWAEKVFYTPSQHRVHHASNACYIDKNHGCFFIIFDRLFGTFAEEDESNKPVYGTTHTVTTHSPSGVNFFELRRMSAYLLSTKSGLSDFLRVVFGSPDYDSEPGRPSNARVPISLYSNSLEWQQVCMFLAGLTFAIILTVIFMQNMAALAWYEITLAVILIIITVDLSAKVLQKN